MEERKIDQAIAASVPGKVLSSHFAGEGPGSIGYAAVVSELGGEYFTSFIEFYDPEASEIPQPQYGIPPTPEGAAVTYRESYPGALEAGERYGFFIALLLEESRLHEEGFEPGLAYLLKVVNNHKNRILSQRLYDSGLSEDPYYAVEIERQLQERVPDPSTREALKSLAALPEDEDQEG